MTDEPQKRLFFKTLDVSKMTDEERSEWAKQLHKRIVSELLKPEPDETESQEPEQGS